MANLEQRLQALEAAQKVQLGQGLILVRINTFGEYGQRQAHEAMRIVSGTGHEWLRDAEEAESQFLERVKRAAGALGLRVITAVNPASGHA